MFYRFCFFFFFKQKTAYEMRISDWSSDVCSSDLRRDRRGDGRGRVGDEAGRLGGGDMFQNDLQRRKIAYQLGERALDEHRLTVEDVDVRLGDLAMDEPRPADRLHPVQNRQDGSGIRDAEIGNAACRGRGCESG